MTEPPPRSPADSLASRLHPRYVAVLVAAAVLILVLGAVFRPNTEQTVSVTRELATLPERSQRRELRDIADYAGQRAAALAGAVVYLPAVGASGVLVASDSVLSVADRSGSPEFLVLPRSASDSTMAPAPTAGLDGSSPGWALALARSPDGSRLSVVGLTGSVVPIQCGEVALHELAFGASVPAAFAGGALFDFDGNALALAVPCAGRVALVPMSDVTAARRSQAMPEYRLWRRFGFRTASPSWFGEGLAGPDSGVAVVETLADGPADRAGLRPGDVITRAAGETVTSPADLELLAQTPETEHLELRRTPGGVALATVPDSGDAPGVELATASVDGLPLGTIRDGSRAGKAGLRSGDRILQVGRDRRPTRAGLDRALKAGQPVFVVYERNGFRRGIVIP